MTENEIGALVVGQPVYCIDGYSNPLKGKLVRRTATGQLVVRFGEQPNKISARFSAGGREIGPSSTWHVGSICSEAEYDKRYARVHLGRRKTHIAAMLRKVGSMGPDEPMVVLRLQQVIDALKLCYEQRDASKSVIEGD